MSMADFIIALFSLQLNAQKVMDESTLILLEQFNHCVTQCKHDLSKSIERNYCARTVFVYFFFTSFLQCVFLLLLLYVSPFRFIYSHPPLSLPFFYLSSDSSLNPLLSIPVFVLPNGNPNIFVNLVCSILTLS